MRTIKSQDIRKTVTDCFNSDPNYLKYHYASHKGLDACIDITVKELNSAQNFELFQVENTDGLVVGMFGVENRYILNPFFIKPEFRNKDAVPEFLHLMKKEFSKRWIVGLYTQNTPVVNFFRRNSGKEISRGNWQNKEIVILEFDNGSYSWQ